jgi:hypothetical protein
MIMQEILIPTETYNILIQESKDQQMTPQEFLQKLIDDLINDTP